MCTLCQLLAGHPFSGDKFFYAAYIDPGTGFVFSSIIPLILGAIATFFASVAVILRKKTVPFIRKNKKSLLIIFFLMVIGTILFVLGQTRSNSKINSKVIILGMDGLDPKIVEMGFKKNLLPNLKRLKETGTYTELQTTMPAQSPVAWASFMTGNPPSKHGVFDFIKRDPKTYLADLVFSDPNKSPLMSKPFWDITAKNDIPTTVLFLPDTFPAPNFNGKMISGMGTPDILGTEGSLTFYSTKNFLLDPKWRGRLVKIRAGNVIKTSLEGPQFTAFNEKKTTSIPFEMQKSAKDKSLIIKIQNQTIKLKKNEFSPWVHLKFSIDFFTKINGIGKFYLKQLDPDIELYLSPMNFDPNNPVYKISSQKYYSKELANEYGLFSTLGLPNDTWALEENIFDEESFLNQVNSVQDERKKIILGELKKFKKGLFFGYFGVTDTIQHMYWRYLNDPESKYQNTILSYYQKIDEIVGEASKNLNKNDLLIVLSDHGFDGYDFEININTWLKENGYLVLNDDDQTGKPLLENVNWSKTKAYAMGYNGIYINLKGREGKGAVLLRDKKNIEEEISSKLIEAINPFNNEKIFKRIYDRKDLKISEDNLRSPDLFLGYYKGIRSSWDTAVGSAPKEVIIKRQSKWSGDHLFDPTEIPGVVFLNKITANNKPKIIDIIPTALNYLGIVIPKSMDGLPIK